MNITFNKNLPQKLVGVIATANKSVDRLNEILSQAREEYLMCQLSTSTKSTLDAIMEDLKNIESELRQFEYMRYANVNRTESLGEFAFIQKIRLKRERKDLTKEIHKLRRERAVKNEQYLQTETKLKGLSEKIGQIDVPTLISEYEQEVLTKLNPCINIITQETGLNIKYVNPYLDMTDLPTSPIEKFRLVEETTSTTEVEEME